MRQHYRLTGLLTSQADDGVSELTSMYVCVCVCVLKLGVGVGIGLGIVVDDDVWDNDPRPTRRGQGWVKRWSRWI